MTAHHHSIWITVPKLIRRLALFVGLVVVALFIVSAPYSTDPRALTPIGIVVFLGIIVFVSRKALGQIRRSSMARWIYLILAVIGLLALVMPVGQAAAAPKAPLMQVVMYTVPQLWHTQSWQAAMQVWPNHSLPAIANVFYQPVVPWQRVILIAMPDTMPDTLQVMAVATAHQVIPIADTPALWNSLPQHSIQVEGMVVVAGIRSNELPPAVILDPVLVRQSCGDCWTHIRTDVNPMFIVKLAAETTMKAGVIALEVSSGPASFIGKMINAAPLINSMFGQDRRAFENELGIWMLSQGVGQLARANLPDSGPTLQESRWLSGYIEDQSQAMLRNTLTPQAVPDPVWAMRTTSWSIGSTSIGTTHVNWETHQVDTSYDLTFNGRSITTHSTYSVQDTQHFDDRFGQPPQIDTTFTDPSYDMPDPQSWQPPLQPQLP